MFKIGIVVFRESLEIALLLGIIMAATKQVVNSRIYVILGSLIGIALAAIFAFFTRTITVKFGGLGDEIFDSGVILLTAAVISWTVVWMQGHTKKIRANLGKLSDNINAGSTSGYILVIVVALTILREGAEIILLVYSIASTENITGNQYIIGLGLGAFSGVAVGIVIYLGLIKYASRYIFKISTILLILISAGLASKAAGILTSAGIIEQYIEPVWDSSALIDDRAILGKTLNIMIGYDAKPNGMQIIFYFSAIAITIIMMKIRAFLSSPRFRPSDYPHIHK